MSNLKEKFEQVINENVNPVSAYGIEGQDKAAIACVGLMIEYLEGMKNNEYPMSQCDRESNAFLDEKISQLKSLIQ